MAALLHREFDIVLPDLPGFGDADDVPPDRITMASAWNLVIVAELVAATEGLGKRISLAQRFLRTDEIFLGLIEIGLIGLAIDLGFRLVMRRSCAWAN